MGTKAVAERLKVAVATVNRWALDDEKSPLPAAAVVLPGPKRAAARLYRRTEIEDAWDRRVGLALVRGACPACTTFTKQVWHNGEPCPDAPAVAS